MYNIFQLVSIELFISIGIHIFQLVSIDLFISIGLHENLIWYQNIFFHWYQNTKMFRLQLVITIGTKMFQFGITYFLFHV